MPENGKRKSGEKARMGLQIDAIKEIEELKSEVSVEGSAVAEPVSETDSIGISLIDLAEILDQHKIWVESGGESGIKADLCGVNLAKADLTGVNLQGAHLHRTNLVGADLSMEESYLRSEEHTSELQSLTNLVCRLLLEKKKKKTKKTKNSNIDNN